MATITEDYVSFEISKLLKEKGFNEYCFKEYYISNRELSNVSIDARYNTTNNRVSAPTLQMAMKWLRIEHNIHIEPIPYATVDGFYWAYKIVGGIISPNIIPLPNYCVKVLKQKAGMESCEEATEAAIKYCLENLI